MIKHNWEETPIKLPTNENKLLEQVINIINDNEEIKTLWRVNNVNAIERLGMSDHGPVHFQIVSNMALRMTRIFKEANIEFSISKNYGLNSDYAEVIIVLASLMHDLGISIHRKGHEEYSLFLANNLLREILSFMPVYERTIVISETLHAIISHRAGGSPLTIEAGIVRVSDALDMSKGRSRIPYEAGNVDIYSVSAQAVDSVEIEKGVETIVQINIKMNNSAALFQVDDLLNTKIKGSGIENYVAVRAYIDRETEKSIVKEYIFKK